MVKPHLPLMSDGMCLTSSLKIKKTQMQKTEEEEV